MTTVVAPAQSAAATAAAAAPAPAAAAAAPAAAPVSKNQISPAVPEKNGVMHSFMVNACRFLVDVKYSPLKPLGRGAYGVVCSALDKVANRKVREQQDYTQLWLHHCIRNEWTRGDQRHSR